MGLPGVERRLHRAASRLYSGDGLRGRRAGDVQEGPVVLSGGPLPGDGFPRVVSLACHDLRTPLATVYGFARTLSQDDRLDERTQRFVGMIEAAAEQMKELLDRLGLIARISGGRWEPAMREADTLELARSGDDRIAVAGRGELIQTAPEELARALHELATAVIRHGAVDRVTWQVAGRRLDLDPLPPAAAAVVEGEEPKDLGELAARLVIEALGGSIAVDGATLRVVV
jgi:signal transduction histidine kinase